MQEELDAGSGRSRISDLITQAVKQSPQSIHRFDQLNGALAEQLGLPPAQVVAKALNKAGSVGSRFGERRFRQPVALGAFALEREQDLAASVERARTFLAPDRVSALAIFVQRGDQWTLGALLAPPDHPAHRLLGFYENALVEVLAADRPAPRYFVLFQRQTPTYGDREGSVYHFTDGSSGAWKQLADSRLVRFVYYRPGSAAGEQRFFGSGEIDQIDPAEDGAATKEFFAHISEYKPFEHHVPISELPRLHRQNSIQEISEEEFERIVALGTRAPPARRPFELDELEAAVEEAGLELPRAVLANVVAAVRSGKHVIFTGPPGTGKTTLAQIVAELGRDAGLSQGYVLSTATADWTTYETIGGLRPSSGDTLTFQAGHFLRAIEQNRWLVIDELNRSNFDRAFGQLFTVLSGQAVVLPYEREDGAAPIALVPEGARRPDHADVVSVPAEWRIIATMNVFDKSLLFEMSYALMRRFAFIEVPSPDTIVFERLIVRSGDDKGEARDVCRALLAVRQIKDLGPSIFIDLARFLTERERIGDVSRGELALTGFYAYLLPQFEGIDRQRGDRLYRTLRGVVGPDHAARLRGILADVLGLDIVRSDEDADGEPVEYVVEDDADSPVEP